MSQFSRRARWINQLFPQSKAPQVQDPGLVSDDVSLVQPYDGSGWGFALETQRTLALVGPNQFVDAFTVDENEVVRFITADCLWLGLGVAPTEFVAQMIDLTALFGVNIATNVIPPSAQPQQYPNLVPIIPPNTRVQLAAIGGDALTQVTFGWSIIRAPLGTVFYL